MPGSETKKKASSAVSTDDAQPSFAAGPLSFGRRGDLEVRLASTTAEIDAAQALRYHVFYEEMSAKADADTLASKRDADRFDTFCDHLLVIDHALVPEDFDGPTPLNAVVGCYRLLRQEVAEQHGGFYTANEFDIEPLLERAGPDVRFLELGRSCVLEPYRNKRTVELLWHGIMHYVAHFNMDVMLGCASFETTDPETLDMPLSYLHYEHLTPEDWYVRALPDRHVEMQRLPKEEVELRGALRAMPPMIKGYIRAGCFIGDGAVVDEQFGTTDVLILFPVSELNERYSSKFKK
jgi:L-ornithine Nalpha-acyltransferase